MDLRQLRYFIAIVEAGSISKAALRCNVVQSALSQQIAALEEELGKPLLIRSSKGVCPSRAGEILQQQAQHILQQVQHARSVISTMDSEPAGPVTVGFPTSTAASLSIPFLQACFQKLPKIELNLMEGLSRQIHQSLNAGSLDIAILFVGQSTHGLKTIPLLTEELFIIKRGNSGHAVDTVGTMTRRDLAEQTLLLPEQGNGLRDLIDPLFHSIDLDIRPRAEIGTLKTMIDAVTAGIGTTILPWGAFAKEHRAGTIAAFRLSGISIRRTLMLCTSGMLPVSDAAHAVVTLIRDLVYEQIQSGKWKHVHLINPCPPPAGAVDSDV